MANISLCNFTENKLLSFFCLILSKSPQNRQVIEKPPSKSDFPSIFDVEIKSNAIEYPPANSVTLALLIYKIIQIILSSKNL
jgi:hypothetical protein